MTTISNLGKIQFFLPLSNGSTSSFLSWFWEPPRLGSTAKAEETKWEDFPVWCRKQRRCLVLVFLSLILTFGCAFSELGALKLNCFLLYYINVEHCKRILGPHKFWDTPIFRFCTIVQRCMCHSGSIPEEAMMAPAGLKQPRMPGPPLPLWRGVFWFCGFSNNFSSFFYHVSNVFCSLKIPRCWVAAYGMMTTALWTLRSRNCNFEPILSHRLTIEGWPWAIQRIWRVLLGEADTGESRKLKIRGWNALKR